ncbi:MAG: methyltransferase domain-containing protein [Chloroflexi bacterium]|nr:methyltransferase domain-containing protein [Chloroflexota bacterium]
MSDKEKSDWEERYSSGSYKARPWPSDLLEEWLPRMPKGRALDIPSGTGRNALYMAENGFEVDAVDISGSALEILNESARERGLRIRCHEIDLDQGSPPEPPYQLLVSCFFLNRNIIPRMKEWVADNGFIVFEQHMVTPLEVHGPSTQQWRVQPNELLRLFADFRVVHYEEGIFTHQRDGAERTNALARLVACKGEPGY